MTKGTLTLTSQEGEIEFTERGVGIRIPRAGIYRVTMSASGMYYGNCKHYLKTDSKHIYYVCTTSMDGTAT